MVVLGCALSGCHKSDPPEGARKAEAETSEAVSSESSADDVVMVPVEEAGAAPIEADLVLGEEVYAANCAGCHGSDGKGLNGAFPVLVGNALVKGDPAKVIRNAMYGVGAFPGAEKPSGNYGDMMPGIGFLSDEEIAAVVSYVRQAWDNGEGPVSVDQVSAQR